MYYYDIEIGQNQFESLQNLTFKGFYFNENLNKRIPLLLTAEQADDYDICDDCGCLIDKNNDDYCYTADDRIICENCYENNYFTCEDCGKVYPNYKTVIVHDNYYSYGRFIQAETYICIDCSSDNYYQCIDCHEFFTRRSGELDSSNDFICNVCIDDYYHCIDCGNWVHVEDVYFCNKEAYCSDCYAEHSFVHPYGYKADFVFNKTEEDQNPCIYYGIELEVSGDKDCADSFLSHFKNNEIYLTEDGSIIDDGFEITTHPMTYSYLTAENGFKQRLTSGLDYLKEQDFKAHNMGGMHVHISKCGITDTQKKQMALILYNTEESKDYDLLLKITQRKNENALDWCNWRVDNKEKLIKALLTNEHSIYGIHDKRRTALNELNTSTLEFRIFNSNLRIERIYKNIEFIQALIDYTNIYKNCNIDTFISLINVNIFTMRDLITYINVNKMKYPNLYDFCIEKNILRAPVLQLNLPLNVAA